MIIVAEQKDNSLLKLDNFKIWLWQVIRFKKPQKVYNSWLIKLNNYLYESCGGVLIKSKRVIKENSALFNVLIDQESIDYLKGEVGKNYTLKQQMNLILKLLKISGYGVKSSYNFITLKEYMDRYFKRT